MNFPSDTGNAAYSFTDNDTRNCYTPLETIECAKADTTAIDCATLGITLDDVNKKVLAAVTDS